MNLKTKTSKLTVLFGIACLGMVSSQASVVTNGTEVTFSVAEGVVETYDEGLATTVTKVIKEGKGTMRLTKAGCSRSKVTVYIDAGILELTNRDALDCYNNIYIASGAQFYQHSAYASGANYATICHYIKGVAGNGPDGKGAIRLDTTTTATSCFRNEVTLTGSASFYCDNNQEMGFSADCPLNLKGHTLTMNGQGTTVFSCAVKPTSPCKVTPGEGGGIVINTPGNPRISQTTKFFGDKSNTLVIGKATSMTVDATATFPWTVVTTNTEARTVTGVAGISAGTKYLLGGNTTHVYSGSVNLGSAGQTGAGAAFVVCSGAVLRCSNPSNPQNVWSYEEGPIPALYRIEAGAIVTNKSASTYMPSTTIRKIATHNWGDYNQIGSAYLANWNGYGFFGLEGGRLHPTSLGYILGMVGSRGMLQQDGGELVYETDMNLSKGGRSEYLMRGGKVAATGGRVFYLAREDDAGYPKVDPPDDFVAFSMVGPAAPCADFCGVINMNCRTGVTTCINLDAGRLIVKHLQLNGATQNYKCYLNLNGGTLVMPTNSWSFLAVQGKTPVMTTIYGNGATVELNNTNRTFLSSATLSAGCAYPLRGAHGRGIKSVKLPADMPKTGYRGILPTKVVNADGDATGNGAQAALDFDVASGTIKDDLIILCPGCDYTAAPKITVYGSDYVTTYECTVELMDEDQVPGPFVKTGVGELVLNSSNNEYAGPYIISNGILMVNYNAQIPASSEVLVAGGCFCWDWRSRTIARFGGHGTFFGSRNDSSESLTVTDRFTVDADDLNAGRFLAVDEIPSEEGNGKYAKNDAVRFGDNCRVVVRNADRLDAEAKGFLLLHQQTQINRLPTLETEIENARLILRKNKSELWLKRTAGLAVIVR